MSELKAISHVPSDPDLNRQVKDSSSVAAVEPPPEGTAKTSVWRRIVGLVWDSVEGDREYRKYVQRLDTFFLYALSFLATSAIFGF